jgi:hypothetical protein
MHAGHSPGARLAGPALAAVVIAIFAAGLARGQDDWHDALAIVGALLEVLAVAHATRRLWLARLPGRLGRRALESGEGERPSVPALALTEEEALVAGGLFVAGVLLTLAGSLAG